MNAFNNLLDDVEDLEDQSEVVNSNYEFEVIPAGKTMGRFIEYIELGKHSGGSYNGKPKPDAEAVRLTFELLHPTKNVREFEKDGVKIKHGQLISIQLKKSLSEKAKFKKLFNSMTYGRPVKHLARLLGDAFLMEVYHNVVKKDGKDITYVNLDKDGVWSLGAPRVCTDPIAETYADVPVPEATFGMKLFLWDKPTKETWDSLFIDGTREVKKDDGSVEHVSRNWLQERILSARNYAGSSLHHMLEEVNDLPVQETVQKAEAEKPLELPASATEKPAETAPAKEADKPASKPATSAEDALAALGLV